MYNIYSQGDTSFFQKARNKFGMIDTFAQHLQKIAILSR